MPRHKRMSKDPYSGTVWDIRRDNGNGEDTVFVWPGRYAQSRLARILELRATLFDIQRTIPTKAGYLSKAKLSEINKLISRDLERIEQW